MVTLTHVAIAACRSGRAALRLCSALPVLLLALALAAPGAAQPGIDASERNPFAGAGQPQFLPVEEAYPLAVERIGEHSLRLVWQMPPGYYLYQHAFRFTVTHDGERSEPRAELPPALTREDEYFGRVQVYYDDAEVILHSERALSGGELSVTSQGCADAGLCYPPRTQHFLVAGDGSVSELADAPAQRGVAGRGQASAPAAGLAAMLLLALAGGLILNLMPCVLPILSLKALSFASCAPAQRHRHGWFYGAGVVASFLAVAVLMLALRGAGKAVGWGFQLQSPTFVIGLGYLFTLIGLGLSGALNIGSAFMGWGNSLTGRGGASGSFLTGVLAVVVASPCTAPFMGAALGFALTQPAPVAVTVFAALGIGMALPLLLLSYSELARRHLPRPGVWMERLKQALAFPLYATALWLFWVAGRQAGVDVMAAALLGALLLALALWLWRGGLPARTLAAACAACAVAILFWRPAAGGAAGAHLPAGSVAYSPQRLEQLLAQRQPVFVDVTADWCITCLANERAVLGRDRVQAAFDANIAGLLPEVLRMMGRLKFRTSYGQNQLSHAVEVSKLAGILAAELGANVELAKQGGFLHDIGKAMDHNQEGTHATLGAEFCKRYGVNPNVVNAIASHHHEHEQESIEAVIAEAADAISGARPGARRRTGQDRHPRHDGRGPRGPCRRR